MFRSNFCDWAIVVIFYGCVIAFLSVLTRCVSGPMPLTKCLMQMLYIFLGCYLWYKILGWGENFYYKRLAGYVQRIRAGR